MSEQPSTFSNPNDDTRITTGTQVALHFSVALENGIEIDNTRANYSDPVSLVIGDGNLLPGFEQALLGLRAGDRRTVHLPPEDAFGAWNPDNIQRFDRAQFALTGEVPVVGTMMEFTDKGGSTLPGVISKVTDDQVEVDFNHPLAGRNVVFEVEIAKVTPPGASAVKLA